MIDIFEALGWLNALNSDSYLNNEVRRLIKGALTLSHSDRRVRLILDRLRNAGHSSNDPLEKAEILLHCAAIEYLHRRYSWAVCDVNEAVVSYDKDDHRRAVALWMLGMGQWEIFQNHNAYASWDKARKIFQERQICFQHSQIERDWYKNRVWEMNVESAAHPEEILTWLNCFERSSLRWSSQQIIKSVQDKIRQQVYPNIYVLMQDFQKAHKRTREVYERAEVYLQFGLAFYQMGNSHSAIQLLRESVQNFVPGIGSYHKQAVARCMLGAVEWRNKSSYNEAAAHWKRSIQEFEKLRGLAAREDILVRREWYTEHRATLLAALYKLKQLHAMI